MQTAPVELDYSTHSTISELAHELRQPLSAIASCAFLLEIHLAPGDDKCRGYVESLKESLDAAVRILESAL